MNVKIKRKKKCKVFGELYRMAMSRPAVSNRATLGLEMFLLLLPSS